MSRTISRLKKTTAVMVALAAAALAVPGNFASASAATPDEYAALGDSYSAGNGAFSTNLDWFCGRNTYAYAPLVAAARPNTHLTFVACQGAVTDDVISEQVDSLSVDTDYVTMTIGGNDVGFANLIINCAGAWSPGCEGAADDSKAKITDELPAKLDAAYAAIRAKAPNATVVILGYARLFGKDIRCAAADGISAQETVWANEVADLLDATIADRVAAAGFTYRSQIKSFKGHDMCARDPWVNGKSWSIADGYHPTRNGYADGMAPAVRSVIG